MMKRNQLYMLLFTIVYRRWQAIGGRRINNHIMYQSVYFIQSELSYCKAGQIHHKNQPRLSYIWVSPLKYQDTFCTLSYTQFHLRPPVHPQPLSSSSNRLNARVSKVQGKYLKVIPLVLLPPPPVSSSNCCKTLALLGDRWCSRVSMILGLKSFWYH